jgi:ABC-type sugar transport system permease subunit
MFLLPELLFFALFLIGPCVQVVVNSFESGGILTPIQFVGLKNWAALPANSLATQSMMNAGRYALMAIPAMLLIGLGLALALVYVRRGGAILRSLIYFPTLAPVVVSALIWLFVVHADFGGLNLTLRLLGGHGQNWLGSPTLALPTVAALEVWRGIGFWSLFFLATLLGLPQELYHAAHLDGAGAWQRFRHLTWPLIRRGVLFAVVVATIYNLQLFDSVFVLTDGGPSGTTTTIAWYVYHALFTFGDIGLGATASVLLLLVILSLTLVEMRLLRSPRGS